MPNAIFKPFNPGSNDTMEIIGQIARKNGVRYRIDYESRDPILWFSGVKNEQVNNAAVQVSEVLLPRRGQKTLWKPALLIAPLLAAEGAVCRMDKTHLGIRPTLDRSSVQGKVSMGASSDVQDTRPQYLATIEKKVSEALQNLSMVPSRLRMRVQFGTFYLKEWNNALTCSLKNLSKAVEECGRRGSTRFDQS
jgi:hypothetical protein